MFIYYDDKKTLCITYAKVGSSFLGSIGLEKRGFIRHKIIDKHVSNFENLLILYRDPYERFYSGIIQAMITSSYFTPQDIENFSSTKNIDFSNVFTNRTFWNHKLTLLKQRIGSNPHFGNLQSFFNSMYEWHRHCNLRLVEYKNRGYLDYIDHFVNLRDLNSKLKNLGYEINQVRPEVTNSTNNNLHVENKEEVLNILKSEWSNIGLEEETNSFLKEEVEIFNFIENYVGDQYRKANSNL